MDKQSLVADTINNSFIKKYVISDIKIKYVDSVNDWETPLSKTKKHVLAEMNVPHETFYLHSQLEKTHRNFYHHLADRLLKLN